MEKFILEQIKESINVKQIIIKDDDIIFLIKKVSEKCIEVYRKGGKVLIAGNGGSAADAQHIAGEFVSKFYFNRPGLAAIALTTDTSILTAIGNDYGFETIFSRQIEAVGSGGDLFIAISTSGNSLNVIRALEACTMKGITKVGLTGNCGGKMAVLCDYCITVPSNETPRIQESHIMIGHLICSIVEQELFGKGF